LRGQFEAGEREAIGKAGKKESKRGGWENTSPQKKFWLWAITIIFFGGVFSHLPLFVVQYRCQNSLSCDFNKNSLVVEYKNRTKISANMKN